MHRRHHLSFAVERQFVDTRRKTFEFRFFSADFHREVDERYLRRVAVNAFFNGRVGAEAHSFREEREVLQTYVRKFFAFDDFAVGVSLDNGHFVLSERACFIGADDRNRAERFHGREFSHNRVGFHHFLNAYRENYRNHGGQSFGNRRDGERNGR